MFKIYIIQKILCKYSAIINKINNIIPNVKLCEIVVYFLKYNIKIHSKYIIESLFYLFR
jgi:hypothetical protein